MRSFHAHLALIASLAPGLVLVREPFLSRMRVASAVSPTDSMLIDRVAALERRNAELERLLAARDSLQRRVVAPFEVVDRTGKVIFKVMEGEPAGGSVVVSGGVNGGRHGIYVLDQSGTRVAGLGQAPEGYGSLIVRYASGRNLFSVRDGAPTGGGVVVTGGDGGARQGLYILNDNGARVAGIAQAPEGHGALALRDQAGKNRIRAEGTGVVTVYDAAGKVGVRISETSATDAAGEVPRLGITYAGDGGAVRAANASGLVVAAMRAGVRNAGAFIAGDQSGQGVAEMSVSSDGRGLFQVFGRGNKPVAILTQGTETPGGLLQILNTAGPVANVTVSSAGAGYLQLTSAGGVSTVEAGTLPSGVGLVRVGPTYRCAGGRMGLGLPDCLMGLKQ